MNESTPARREPVYPPLQVSFEVGPSATALHPAGSRHDVAAADWPQTFRLPPNAPVGFLMPCLFVQLPALGVLFMSQECGLGRLAADCSLAAQCACEQKQPHCWRQ